MLATMICVDGEESAQGTISNTTDRTTPGESTRANSNSHRASVAAKRVLEQARQLGIAVGDVNFPDATRQAKER
jgi:hypothetical protein